jgi:hypothetical protein
MSAASLPFTATRTRPFLPITVCLLFNIAGKKVLGLLPLPAQINLFKFIEEWGWFPKSLEKRSWKLSKATAQSVTFDTLRLGPVT